MSTETDRAWERFKTNMAPMCVEPASSERATSEPAGQPSSLALAHGSVCCPKCYGVGYFVRTRYFGTSAADVWECQSPNCTGFGLIWHTERPYNDDEKHAVRHRVLLAESAVMKARQAVIDAEVELAVARSIAATALLPNAQDEPHP